MLILDKLQYVNQIHSNDLYLKLASIKNRSDVKHKKVLKGIDECELFSNQLNHSLQRKKCLY